MRAIVLGLLFVLLAPSAQAAVAPAQAPLDLADPVRDKNLYLFRLVERRAEAKTVIVRDPDLSALGAAYVARLKEADRTCAADPGCYVAAARVAAPEAGAAEQALRRLYAAQPTVRRLVDADLAASGVIAPPASGDGADLLAAAWREHLAVLNRVLDTYGAGVPPPYPQIDSPADDPKAPAFARRLRQVNALVIERAARPAPFFEGPVQYAMLLLKVEGRDEAGRHEPLETGENAAARARFIHTDWARFPYSAILVPGAGPDRPEERLSAAGRLRLELAVDRWRAGKAPFLVVSGGYVHPIRTPYAEAVQMKRYLIDALKVPAAAILIEPHARHTTTNLRNTVRILYRDGAPPSKKVLIVTDQGQAAYIAAPVFDERNLKETGVLPYRDKAQLGPFEVEFTPSVDALQVSAFDPLDP